MAFPGIMVAADAKLLRSTSRSKKAWSQHATLLWSKQALHQCYVLVRQLHNRGPLRQVCWWLWAGLFVRNGSTHSPVMRNT